VYIRQRISNENDLGLTRTKLGDEELLDEYPYLNGDMISDFEIRRNRDNQIKSEKKLRL